MSICIVLGLFIGIMAIALFFGLVESADSLPPAKFTAEVQPNAKGSRKILSKSAPVVLKLSIDGTIGTEMLNSKMISEMFDRIA